MPTLAFLYDDFAQTDEPLIPLPLDLTDALGTVMSEEKALFQSMWVGGLVSRMPLVAAPGFYDAINREMSTMTGLPFPQKVLEVRSVAEAAAVARAHWARGLRTHVFAPSSPEWDAQGLWPNDLALQRHLLRKSSLAQYVPAAACPRRFVLARGEIEAKGENLLPCVLKAVTETEMGGGRGVRLCDTPADLSAALSSLAAVETFVVEERLEVQANLSLCFAVRAVGDVLFLGFSEQLIANGVEYAGNVFDRDAVLPAQVAKAATATMEAIARTGYVGFAGCDVLVLADGSCCIIDLNIRQNGSTLPCLLHKELLAGAGKRFLRGGALSGRFSHSEGLEVARAMFESGLGFPIQVFPLYDAPGVNRVRAALWGSTSEAIVERRVQLQAGLDTEGWSIARLCSEIRALGPVD